MLIIVGDYIVNILKKISIFCGLIGSFGLNLYGMELQSHEWDKDYNLPVYNLRDHHSQKPTIIEGMDFGVKYFEIKAHSLNQDYSIFLETLQLLKFDDVKGLWIFKAIKSGVAVLYFNTGDEKMKCISSAEIVILPKHQEPIVT
jgi:hypothetical protein